MPTICAANPFSPVFSSLIAGLYHSHNAFLRENGRGCEDRPRVASIGQFYARSSSWNARPAARLLTTRPSAECKFYRSENEAADGSSAKDPIIVRLFPAGTALALGYLRRDARLASNSRRASKANDGKKRTGICLRPN